MSPEPITENLWRLKDGECIRGITTTGDASLTGPLVVRVTTFDEPIAMLVQSGETKLQVDGNDFAKAVENCK